MNFTDRGTVHGLKSILKNHSYVVSAFSRDFFWCHRVITNNSIILFFLINEEFVISVITYFGGSFLPLPQSKALYKVGFFEEITGDLQKKAEFATRIINTSAMPCVYMVIRQNIAGDVNNVFKSLLTMPSNVLPLHLKQTFPPMI